MADNSTFINTLHSLTGLNVDVITRWVSLENGVNNNILGVTTGGRLASYPNQTVAAQATASLINTSSNYAGIRASYGGSSARQALAIIQSPWHSTSATNYYIRGFASLTGSLTPSTIGAHSSTPSGGASTPTVPSATIPGLSLFQQQLASIGISSDPNHQLTYDEIMAYQTKIVGNGSQQVNDLIAKGNAGKTVSDLAGISASSQSLLPKIDLGSAVYFVAIILVGITFLFLGGIIILKGPKGATT